MRIAALVESENHVCCRYRLRAFAPAIHSAGSHLEICPLPRGLARWRLPTAIASADVVILQRKLLPSWELGRLRRHARRLVFDFDDAVFLRDSYHPKGIVSGKLHRRFRATMQAVDMVVAGNDWLADQARRAGASHVVVIPTCIEPSLYSLAHHQNDSGPLKLVWLGSSSTLQGLQQATPLLELLGQTVPDLALRVICDQPIHFQHLRVENVTWTPTAETAALVDADVGISILPDDDWSRGKCGLKVLQYMAAGLPVVGNDVGVTSQMLGINTARPAGILADRPQQWLDALTQLRDCQLRRTMGNNGRHIVEQGYSVSTGGRVWQSLLNDNVQQRRAG